MAGKRFIESTLRLRACALILVAVALVFSVSGWAQASTNAVNTANSQVQDLKTLLAQLDEQLSAVTESYDYSNQQLADTQAAVTKTSNDLSLAQSDLAAARSQFNERVVQIYKNGDVSALAVLMNANSFSDLVNRYEQLSRISKQDADLVAQVKAYTTQVAANKAKLDAEKKKQTADLAQTAAAKQKVLGQVAKQTQALKGKEALVAQLRKEEAAQQAALAAAAKKAADKAAAQEVAQAAAAGTGSKRTTSAAATTTSSSSPPTTARSGKTTTTRGGRSTTTTVRRSPPTTSASPSPPTTDGGGGSSSGGVSGAAVVSYAVKFVGVPYVWGASSPSGFDCSGFVMYVYAHFGISLPHSSAMQYGYGTPVAQSELKAGDLVFFYSPIHHVGLALGNGQMIDCRTGGVQIESVYWSSYTGARRILH